MATKPSILDAVKIQARAVIPIVKALEREVGKERAFTIVGSTIADDCARRQSNRIPVKNLHPRSGDSASVFPVETQGATHCDFRWRLRSEDERRSCCCTAALVRSFMEG
jgi:hypothetical protein